MRPLRRLAVGLWIAVFVLAGVFLASRMLDPPVRVQNLPEPTQGPPRPAPAVLPEIRLPDLAGEQRTTREWTGRTLVINFWATWCAPCRREMPLLEQLHQETDATQLQILGIAIDRLDPVLRFVGETGVTYPILVGEMDATRAAERFGDAFVGLPFTVVAAPDGTILAIHTGELDAADMARIAAVADRLAGGELTPAQARSELELG